MVQRMKTRYPVDRAVGAIKRNLLFVHGHLRGIDFQQIKPPTVHIWGGKGHQAPPSPPDDRSAAVGGLAYGVFPN